MTIELINTGAELMLGRVLNSHQQWICRQLADLGHRVTRQVAVDDSGPAIGQAVREALARADLVITTGGLGPTSDDRTRDQIAALLGCKLRQDDETLKRIEAFFAQRRRPMPDRVKVQAQVPEGALVLINEHGTAPGLAMRVTPNPFRAGNSWLVMLPGPPRELQPMFVQSVVPLLQREFPLGAPFVCRTIRTIGMGESRVEELIDAPLAPLVGRGLELAYCAHVGSVDVRLVATGGDAAELVSQAEAIVQAKLGAHIFGYDEEELPGLLVKRLTERGRTLTLAESCTGGHIADQITNVPGASVVLLAGLVTYSNEAKQTLLGVRAETLATHGAVSEPVAREMAEGARKRIGSDFALAVTGVAGPGGGTAAKPVGTVFIALASPEGTRVVQNFNAVDRLAFKEVTSRQALNLLRLHLGGN